MNKEEKSESPIAILYHKADLDGILSGVVAMHGLLTQGYQSIETIGCDYGDVPIRFNPDAYDQVFVLDFSDDDLFEFYADKITWIDHHASAISKHSGKSFKDKYLIDGVAACRLAHQYFNYPDVAKKYEKKHYHLREVIEPLMVALAGEHDIWDKTSPYATAFNFGIASNLNFDYVNKFYINTAKIRASNDKFDLGGVGPVILSELDKGQAVINFVGQTASRLGKTYIELDNITFEVFNTSIRSSLVNPKLDKGEATMVWSYEPSINAVRVSMYCDNPVNMNLGEIAKRFGGGGHHGAAGFQMEIHKFVSEILKK